MVMDMEGNPAICDKMDRPWVHCAKWLSKRPILYNSTYMWNLEKAKLIKREYNDDYQELGVRDLGRCCLRIQTCN